MVADSNIVAFPGLGLEFDLDPIAFTVFGRHIMWYGILMASAILIGLLITMRMAKKNSLVPDDVMDLVLWATPFAIIGARAYYVIFNLEYYKSFWEVIAIWNGGLAMYGSIIGAVIVALIYTHFKGMNRGKVFDVCAYGLLIGQVIGRFGNFMNREAYGTFCSLPWRMEIFDKMTEMRVSVHPTFLYESLWNLLGLVLLLIYFKKRKFNGEIFALYVAWYGLGRAFIEGLRTDSLYIMGTNLRVSQVLALISFLIAGAILLFLYTKKRYQTLKLGIGFINNLESPAYIKPENKKKDIVSPAEKAEDGEPKEELADEEKIISEQEKSQSAEVLANVSSEKSETSDLMEDEKHSEEKDQ